TRRAGHERIADRVHSNGITLVIVGSTHVSRVNQCRACGIKFSYKSFRLKAGIAAGWLLGILKGKIIRKSIYGEVGIDRAINCNSGAAVSTAAGQVRRVRKYRVD